MAKYRMYVPVPAEMWTTVEVDETDPEGNLLSESELVTRVLDEAKFNTPTLCHQCSDWKRDVGLEIGDEWDWDKMKLEKADD